jgi:type IV pilus assembly protein PilM
MIAQGPIVCLDLSLDRLAAIQGGDRMVQRWTVQPLDPALLRNGDPVDPERLGAAIRRALASAGMEATRARVTLADEAAVVRVVAMPRMPARHLMRAVPFVAEQTLPFQLDRARLGWDVLERQPTQTLVLLACAWQDLVDRLVEATRLAGLEPETVEPRSLSVGRALGRKNALLFDAGERTLQLTVLARTHPTFSDQVPYERGQEEAAMLQLRLRARRDPEEEEMVLVAGRLEESFAAGAFAESPARLAAQTLNGHGPTRPLEMPSGMLLAPLGLAIRRAGDGYPQVNLLPESDRRRIVPMLRAGVEAVGSATTGAAASVARRLGLRRTPFRAAEGGRR